MKQFLPSALFVACAAFASAAYGQNQNPGQAPPSAPPSAQSQPDRQSDASTVSITGCLTKGSGAGAYIITDQKSGDKYPFSGPAQLDKFVNQTVTLSGAMTSQGGDKAFKPERIAPVSASCEKAQ